MTATMRWVIGTVAVLVAAGLGWAIWTSTLAGQNPDGSAAPGTAQSPGDGANGSSGQSGSAEATPTTGPSPGATPVDGSEVTSPDPQQTDSARLPPLPQPTPLIAAPLPDNGSAQGGIVDGFPIAVAGAMPQSDVIDSSITSDGSTMQAALNARTDESPDAITTHYRQVWTELGLAPLTDDGATLAYGDTFTSVSLAVRESGTGVVYTVYATLRTE